MSEIMTKSMARNIFYGGTVFFLLIFAGLVAQSHSYIVNTSTDAKTLTPSVVAGKRIWEAKGCINCNTLLGEGAYYAPELLAGEDVTPRSDLYSLGVMLFELLAGRRPHDSASMGELLRQVANHPPPDLAELRPALPRGLAELVTGLLAKQASSRPAEGTRLAAELLAWAEQLQEPESTANSGKLSR